MTADTEQTARRLREIEQVLTARTPENIVQPGLERIAFAMSILGDPHTAYPVIHIAGTNGKTSTSRMIEALLREFGISTGLMTSPHLHDLRERIRLNGLPVDAERFIEAYDEIEPYLQLVDERVSPMSYFEAMTALGFAIFADAPVGAAVIEVGLGGEFDATNVVSPQVTVITPIGMDHQEYLGEDIVDVAAAKAGILKAGAVPVLARQTLPVAEVIVRRCGELDLPMVREGLEFGVLDRQVAIGGQLLTLRGIAGEYPEILLPLHGEHQAANAALALAAVEAFFGASAPLDLAAVQAAFAGVSSPGRCEIVRRSPTVIVDAAHNPHGAAALANTLADSFDLRHTVGVIAVLAGKDALGLLQALEPVLDEVVISRSNSPRAMHVNDLADIAVQVFGEERVHTAEELGEALELATSLVDEHIAEGGVAIVCTGSVVTAAEVRALVGKHSA